MECEMGLEHLFDTPSAKILDLLIDFRHFDYSINDLVEGTGVSFRTIQRTMPKLIKEGLVLKTRREGRAQMYIINYASLLVRILDKLSLEESLQRARSLARPKQKQVAVPDIMRLLPPSLAR
ncbi:hypothetical protein HY546_02250 [archaeon]|nr:hypothetical protein [archaeon]